MIVDFHPEPEILAFVAQNMRDGERSGRAPAGTDTAVVYHSILPTTILWRPFDKEMSTKEGIQGFRRGHAKSRARC